MLPRIIDGTAFDGVGGFIATSASRISFGRSTAGGDIDGDGEDELVSGSPNIVNIVPSPGSIQVKWGGSDSQASTFDLPGYGVNNCKGFSMQGGNGAGMRVALGNVDGGVAKNLIVLEWSSGILYIFRSGNRAIFANMGLGSFTSQHGYKITNLPGAYQIKIADLDGNRVDDIIFSVPNLDKIYIIWGIQGGFPPVSSFANMTSAQKSEIVGIPRSNFAYSMELVDLNHDGQKDLLISDSLTNNGTVYGILTQPGAYPASRNATTTSEFKITVSSNDTAHFGAGTNIGVAENITADGESAIVVCGGQSSYAGVIGLGKDTYTNFCAVIYGKQVFVPEVSLSAMGPEDGFFMELGDYDTKNPLCIGEGGIGAVDFNGDLINDLYITNPCMGHNPAYSLSYNINNGSVAFLFGGNRTNFRSFYNRTDLIDDVGYDWKGTGYNAFGFDVIVFDHDGDGKLDLAVSAPYANTAGTVESVYVVLSSTNKTSPLPCLAPQPPTQTSSIYDPIPMTSGASSRRIIPNYSFGEVVVIEPIVNAFNKVKRPLIYGATNGVANVVDHALEKRGYSQTARYIATGALYSVYYAGVYTVSYNNRYAELSKTNMPENDKHGLASHQALSETATLALTQVAAKVCEKACHWLGGVAQNKGWTAASDLLSWFGQTTGYGAYLYQPSSNYGNGGGGAGVSWSNRATDVGTGVANVAAGIAAEAVVTKVGKAVVDVLVTPAEASAHRHAVVKLFDGKKKPTHQPDAVMRVSNGHR